MKKSQLVQLIREELRGFSKYAPQGVTKGGTTDDFMQILTRIAKGDKEKYQGDPDRGNKLLDKANPENVKRILRGEDPIYEDKHQTYSKSEVIRYLSELDPNTEVKIPDILPKGFSPNVGWRTTAQEAVQALQQAKSDGQFELLQDLPKYKNFSLVQTPQQLQAREKLVRGMGPLD
jgi:ABC-type transport system substrate-binding protein